MALLKFRQTTPPGGWKFIQWQTRLHLSGDSLQDLVSKVIDHRRYRHLEPADLASVQRDIERQICSRLSEQECRAEGKDDEWVPISADFSLSSSTVIAFTKTLLEWFKSGGKLEPMDEVQRRRSICVECPLNVPLPGKCNCAPFYRLIEMAVPKARRFDDLHICAACKCANNAKVSLPIEILRKSTAKDVKFPVHCWQAEKPLEM